MRPKIQKRLELLEGFLGKIRRHRFARILCDPKILHSIDTSQIDADTILILPDNGLRLLKEDAQKVPKGSYLIFYS